MGSPQEEMNRLLSGYWLSKAIYVAAKLGIADLLAHVGRSADDLARETKTHGPSLYRMLRALASVGVFVEDTPGRFSLTHMATCLRSDVPGSQRALAIMLGEEQFRAWSEFLYCVQTGKTAFDRVFGMPAFDYLSTNPEQAKVFDAAMVGVHGRETSAMTEVYFAAARKEVVDGVREKYGSGRKPGMVIKPEVMLHVKELKANGKPLPPLPSWSV
jgi:hypothetical protein